MMIPRHCEDCDLINLGTYSFGSYQGISDKVSLVEMWGRMEEDGGVCGMY